MKALITGAGSGIGKSIALRLSSDGYDIIAVGRDEKKLRELKNLIKTELTTISLDLKDKENCYKLHKEVAGEDISILVNNAGFGVFGPFDETDLEGELELIDVNITAVHILTKLFLKDFMRRNSGYILNVSSSAGFFMGPLFSSYYASKSYVLRLSQAVREELRRKKSKVYVGAFCPGPITTEFNKNAGIKVKTGGLSAEYAADYAVRKMYAHKGVIVPGFVMKCMRVFSKIVPDPILAPVVYKMQQKKQG